MHLTCSLLVLQRVGHRITDSARSTLPSGVAARLEDARCYGSGARAARLVWTRVQCTSSRRADRPTRASRRMRRSNVAPRASSPTHPASRRAQSPRTTARRQLRGSRIENHTADELHDVRRNAPPYDPGRCPAPRRRRVGLSLAMLVAFSSSKRRGGLMGLSNRALVDQSKGLSGFDIRISGRKFFPTLPETPPSALLPYILPHF
ncbi:hypothetical protein B0H17DRAFT_1082160 [Mycena rosella]|uniref:Uncharacterized protein n=1 Tax=Mycena rosella TaxID=1033263 RepID=A0AAD7D5B3_MYCRO|nr:hypothetical protein B0H17DRAFT_1082160 [Mycena rosella]